MRTDRILHNPRMRVFWDGWESTTLTLQRCGWQLSMEQDFNQGGMRLAIYHPRYEMYGVSEVLRYDILHHLEYQYREHELPGFRIAFMASKITFTIAQTSPLGFEPVDARPEMRMLPTENVFIEDLKIFRPIEGIQEVILPEPGVNELLASILSKQEPKQAEIRERVRREKARRHRAKILDFRTTLEARQKDDYNPASDIVAQIIAIGR